MTDGPLIMLKFAVTQKEKEFKAMIESWVGDALVKSQPLFPDIDDADLSTIYQVFLRDGCDVKEVLVKLRTKRDVEYAHEPAEKNPKRS